MSEICCGLVWSGFHQRTCGRNAKFERNGLWFCGTHDPVAIKQKNDKRNAEYQAKWEAREKATKERQEREAEIERRAGCYDDLLDALKRILACYSTSHSPELRQECWEQVRAAIAKATGDQQ